LAAWARGITWCCADPADVVPLQPSSADDPPPCEINRSFFEEWAAKLGWTDHDMLGQVRSGVDSRTQCDLAIVLRWHHKGLEKHAGPALDSVEEDAAEGREWISRGSPHLPTVPCRLVAKNVAVRKSWKEVAPGRFEYVIRFRVTTDDSAEEHELAASRNAAMPRDEWPELALPEVAHLGRAVAILKAVMPEAAAGAIARLAFEAGLRGETIVLWALDLSDAYRKLAINRAEQWLQCFIWYDGVRQDRRCVFGAAHMVQFFERVSTFLLAVVRYRQREFDRGRPYSAARQQWLDQRGSSDVAFGMVYIDDLIGCCVHGAGEPIRRRTNAENAVADSSAEETRVEAHVSIAARTCAEAGWAAKLAKTQIGERIDPLGFAVDSAGAGRIFVPAAKRHGLDVELQAMQGAAGAALRRDSLEETQGRLVHVAAVVVEGRPHLEPLYTFLRVRKEVVSRGGVVAKLKPRKLDVCGAGPAQRRFQQAVRWWRAAVAADLSVPLAPRLVFPPAGEAGVVLCFQDAARERGTGFGGFAPFTRPGTVEKQLLVCAQMWPEDLREALYTNRLSMPAGELFAFVCLVATICHHVAGVTHAISFSDASAAVAAINSERSGSPQMQALLSWFYELCPELQSLAVWIEGKDNERADDLSRGRGEAVVREAREGGWEPHALPPPPGAFEVLRAIAALPHFD